MTIEKWFENNRIETFNKKNACQRESQHQMEDK